MSRLKPLLTSVRVWILAIFIVLSLVAISPHLSDPEGVAVRQVVKESAAAQAGMKNPEPGVSPTHRERVLEINGRPVESVSGYYEIVSGYPPNASMRVLTTQATYTVTTRAADNATSGANGSDAQDALAQDIGLVVYEPPRSNIRLGLDLSGGTRVILKPQEEVSREDLELIIENIKERLNVYGLSDIVVRDARDLSGDDFIVVEIAGANKDEVRELLGNQGKFEAKIGEDAVFRGGEDITYVCRTAECSGIDRTAGCSQSGGQWACRFSFEIQLSPEAAQRQADLTRDLAVVYNESTQGYLEHPLDLYLDDEPVDSLQIAADLKGQAATSILISGAGFGPTQQAAAQDAIANMKTLQTVMVTGSLPVKLDIVKSDGISPALGGEFVRNAMLLILLSVLAVAIVIATRYRRPIISIPVIITMLAEVIITLGFAAAVGWNMDLAAIAAIIISIGSGVDDQIVMIDETSGGGAREQRRSWKEKVSSAFFIIFASYFTLAAAMIPLFFAGAGLLRGFAITTVVGITAGVLITRPAFAHFIEALLKKDEE